MKEIAIALGFVYSRTGCPCKGSPAMYKIKRDGKLYDLTIWERRNIWEITSYGYRLGGGNKDDMKQKIEELWDL